MTIKPIRSEADYQAALKLIDRFIDAEEGTPEADALEVVSTLVADYEDKHHPIDPPHPIEAIKFRMEQMGLTRKNLTPILGTRSRVSEVLNLTRPLTIKMIRQLNTELDIPAEVLIKDYKLKRTPATKRTPRRPVHAN